MDNLAARLKNDKVDVYLHYADRLEYGADLKPQMYGKYQYKGTYIPDNGLVLCLCLSPIHPCRHNLLACRMGFFGIVLRIRYRHHFMAAQV